MNFELDNIFQCKICNYIFNNIESLIFHENNSHFRWKLAHNERQIQIKTRSELNKIGKRERMSSSNQNMICITTKQWRWRPKIQSSIEENSEIPSTSQVTTICTEQNPTQENNVVEENEVDIELVDIVSNHDESEATNNAETSAIIYLEAKDLELGQAPVPSADEHEHDHLLAAENSYYFRESDQSKVDTINFTKENLNKSYEEENSRQSQTVISHLGNSDADTSELGSEMILSMQHSLDYSLNNYDEGDHTSDYLHGLKMLADVADRFEADADLNQNSWDSEVVDSTDLTKSIGTLYLTTAEVDPLLESTIDEEDILEKNENPPLLLDLDSIVNSESDYPGIMTFFAADDSILLEEEQNRDEIDELQIQISPIRETRNEMLPQVTLSPLANADICCICENPGFQKIIQSRICSKRTNFKCTQNSSDSKLDPPQNPAVQSVSVCSCNAKIKTLLVHNKYADEKLKGLKPYPDIAAEPEQLDPDPSEPTVFDTNDPMSLSENKNSDSSNIPNNSEPHAQDFDESDNFEIQLKYSASPSKSDASVPEPSPGIRLPVKSLKKNRKTRRCCACGYPEFTPSVMREAEKFASTSVFVMCCRCSGLYHLCCAYLEMKPGPDESWFCRKCLQGQIKKPLKTQKKRKPKNIEKSREETQPYKNTKYIKIIKNIEKVKAIKNIKNMKAVDKMRAVTSIKDVKPVQNSESVKNIQNSGNVKNIKYVRAEKTLIKNTASCVKVKNKKILKVKRVLTGSISRFGRFRKVTTKINL